MRTLARVQLDGPARPAPSRPSPLPVQDLRVYERYGGHTLHRHVNTPPGDALRRVREEGIAAAGSFLNATIAQRCIEQAINAHRDGVRAWLAGPDRRAPYTFVHETRHVIGRTLTWADVRRGLTVPRYATALRVVLRRRPELPGGFLVVTAYPTRTNRRPTAGAQWRHQ